MLYKLGLCYRLLFVICSSFELQLSSLQKHVGETNFHLTHPAETEPPVRVIFLTLEQKTELLKCVVDFAVLFYSVQSGVLGF